MLTLIGEAHPENMKKMYERAIKNYEKKGIPIEKSEFGIQFLACFNGVERVPVEGPISILVNLFQTDEDLSSKLHDEKYVHYVLNNITKKEKELIEKIKPDTLVLESYMFKKRFKNIDVKKETLEGIPSALISNFWLGYYTQTEDMNGFKKNFVDKRDQKFAEKLDDICKEHDNVVCIVGGLHVPGLCKRLTVDYNTTYIPESAKKYVKRVLNS